MSTDALQQTLRNLATIGTLVQKRDDWQLWHFVHEGRPYLLRFHPASGPRLLRSGSPALREFAALQTLQKASIPAPRAVAVLMGFVLGEGRGRAGEGEDRSQKSEVRSQKSEAGGQTSAHPTQHSALSTQHSASSPHSPSIKGDAVIFESIEPTVPLDRYLNDRELAGELAGDSAGGANHLSLARQVRTLVHSLGRAKMGHDGLGAASFLLSGEKLYLRDGAGVHPGGLKLAEVMRLGHSAGRWATAADLQRGWELLGAGDAMPAGNPISKRLRRQFVASATGENDSFGRLQWTSAQSGGWRGYYFKRIEHPYRWSSASRLTVREGDWPKAWPILLGQMRSDQLTVLKRDDSGDVLEGEVVLAGRPVAVVIKRPRRKYWWRHINEIGRGVRARRAWTKAWQLIARDIPTAWPLLVMERRSLGYTTDAVIVLEKVEGPTLDAIDLNALSSADRQKVFHRAGAILRKMEATGLYHWDAKSTNWIIRPDEKLGPSPLLVDVDGIRRIQWTRSGIGRLLRAMKQHPQYSPEDSLNLCRGYAPWARMMREAE